MAISRELWWGGKGSWENSCLFVSHCRQCGATSLQLPPCSCCLLGNAAMRTPIRQWEWEYRPEPGELVPAVTAANQLTTVRTLLSAPLSISPSHRAHRMRALANPCNFPANPQPQGYSNPSASSSNRINAACVACAKHSLTSPLYVHTC